MLPYSTAYAAVSPAPPRARTSGSMKRRSAGGCDGCEGEHDGDAVHGDVVCSGPVPGPDAAGGGRDDAGPPKAVPEADEDQEDRGGDEPNGGKGIRAEARDPDGVGEVVGGLKEHGDHDRAGNLEDGAFGVTGENGDSFGDCVPAFCRFGGDGGDFTHSYPSGTGFFSGCIGRREFMLFSSTFVRRREEAKVFALRGHNDCVLMRCSPSGGDQQAAGSRSPCGEIIRRSLTRGRVLWSERRGSAE